VGKKKPQVYSIPGSCQYPFGSTIILPAYTAGRPIGRQVYVGKISNVT